MSIIMVLAASLAASAAQVQILDQTGKPLKDVMVTQVLSNPTPMDTSDGEYAKAGVPFKRDPEYTLFTNEKGMVEFPARGAKVNYRFRLNRYQDATVTEADEKKRLVQKMQPELDPIKLAEAKKANIWMGALKFPNQIDKQVFQMQCGFCHQQGTAFIRGERTKEEWDIIIKRMVGYGSRLPSEIQQYLPQTLMEGYRALRENPSLLGEDLAWPGEKQAQWKITEWPIGDSMSQTHDMLFAKNKLVYVADNIQDRLYETDPVKNIVTVYKIPHRDGEKNGGLISARLKEFPRHDSTSNAHSLAESQVDGHIFITPSAQRRLVEFDPATKKFTLYEMEQGFYPHTIRVDQNDDVWFTLALSNQVARFNRKTKTFTYYDLPARSFKEKMITKNISFLFKLMSWGIPISKWLKISRDYQGTPLAYGIDITPDGKAWFARLHTDEIGSVDPKTGSIEMVKTPFMGPRRLRADSEGNLWIVSFGSSALARYSPSTKQFKVFDLPVNPKGSETPYSLNVDKPRGIVWVTGNQSDALYGLNMKDESWRRVRLPRNTTFTRDIEFDEQGSLYTSNSNFPSWHVEDGQPTLIKVEFKK